MKEWDTIYTTLTSRLSLKPLIFLSGVSGPILLNSVSIDA